MGVEFHYSLDIYLIFGRSSQKQKRFSVSSLPLYGLFLFHFEIYWHAYILIHTHIHSPTNTCRPSLSTVFGNENYSFSQCYRLIEIGLSILNVSWNVILYVCIAVCSMVLIRNGFISRKEEEAYKHEENISNERRKRNNEPTN